MNLYEKLNSDYYKNNKFYPLHKMRKEEPDLYKFILNEYRQEDQRIEDEFRKDLEQEFGTDTLPEEVRQTIFSYAKNKGHAYGYSEITNEYSDLTEEVIEPLIKYFKEK